MWSWSSRWPAVPPVTGPCLADKATDGDDRVGQVEECVDHVLAPLVAPLEPAEGVVPGAGVGPLDMAALAGLDRCLAALWAICPVIPRAASSSRVFCESYPASRCTRVSPGSGPRSLSGLDGDVVAEAFEAADVVAGLAADVHALFVVAGAEVLVGGGGV